MIDGHSILIDIRPCIHGFKYNRLDIDTGKYSKGNKAGTCSYKLAGVFNKGEFIGEDKEFKLGTLPNSNLIIYGVAAYFFPKFKHDMELMSQQIELLQQECERLRAQIVEERARK